MALEDIALQMTPGIGVKGAVHLLECFGSAERIFSASADELIGRAELKAELVPRIVRRSAWRDAEKEMEYCHRNGITVIASTDPEYPALLREIPDYPPVLYLKGNVQTLSMRCFSIVGTRQATSYGRLMTDRLIEGLAQRAAEVCIVSGLAFGVDVAAHRAALAAGVPTIAVVANALPEVSPVQHTAVVRDMLAQGGAIVSEMHSRTKQNGTGFIARNRIIAALSAGCLIVESPEKGGSLITARYADEYDRCVMAIPGRTSDPMSIGTNRLINANKAHLVTSTGDILRELNWEECIGKAPASRLLQLTADERGLLGCFRTNDPVATESLAELAGLNPGELATLLLALELAGAVRQLPGDQYMKLV